jgi:hypothetical protein
MYELDCSCLEKPVQTGLVIQNKVIKQVNEFIT